MIFKQESKNEALAEERKENLVKALSTNTPIAINIEPTTICNLKCSFCSVHSEYYGTKIKPESMSMEIHNLIIDQIKSTNWGLKVVWYSGFGEPLLNKDIYEMIKYTKSKKIAEKIILITNGISLTKEVFLKLAEVGVDDIHLSLDAEDRESYEKIKGRDCFDTVISNIKTLIKVAEKPGSPALIIKILDEVTDPVIHENYDTNHILSYLKSLIMDSKNIHVKIVPLILAPNEHKTFCKTCEQIFYYLFFRTNGDVSPCCLDPKRKLVISNVKDRTVEEILSSEQLKTLRLAHLNRNLASYPICKKCQVTSCVKFDNDTIAKIKSIIK